MNKKWLFLLSALFIWFSWSAQSAAVVQKEPEWAAAGKKFVLQLRNGQYEAAVAEMTPLMKSHLTPDKLAQLWSNLQKNAGEFREIERIEINALDTLRQVNVYCRFAKASLNIQVIFNLKGEVAGLWFRPGKPPKYEIPAYADTTRFHEIDLEFGLPGFRLKGTLSLPNGKGPFQAVVLVHGSGPNDRDETVGPNRPFRDLAWGLASRGIAVFRYDKRTYVYGAKMKGKRITVEEEVIQDALAALDTVRKQKEVDATHVFLLGHSLGARVAPEIAYRDGRVAGVILLAAPARKMSELLIEQLHYLAGIKKESSTEMAALDSLIALAQKLARHELDSSTVVLGAPAYYYYDLERRDAIIFAQKLKTPMLFLQGGRDYQVTRADFEKWQQALAGRPNVTFRFYPNLNHLFISGKGMATPEEYMQVKGHVAQEVIEDIVEWIARIK